MSKSLETFKSRYYEHKDKPTVIAFTMKGISSHKGKYPKEILDFAKKHHVKIQGRVAYYPENRKLGRFPRPAVTGGRRKKYSGRGY